MAVTVESLMGQINAAWQRANLLKSEIRVVRGQVERELKLADELLADIERAKSLPREQARRLPSIRSKKDREYEEFFDAPRIPLR